MIEERIKELGIQIPTLPKPGAVYVPARVTGHHVYASGQTPTIDDDLIYKGRLGEELSIEQGYQAARLACVNCLAEIRLVLGSLDKVEKIVKVNGYVRSGKDFSEQPKVVNGASELLEAIFGEQGKHARTSLGVSELPDGAAVVIELIAEIK
jgi:enamine deaminase RidA (YjgF/YER057c/UK114 family)